MVSSSAVLKFILLGEDRTGKAFGSASKGMTGLHKGALLVATGTAAVGAALFSMAKNAAEDERGQRRLAVALHNTAGANAATVASVEQWISRVGVATGVTDDEMRPAFQRLVQATRDVGEAQDLMKVAMDASAGTGKSLEAVTTALAKAQNGNMGALSRLGIRIKDADGKALSFKDTVAQMAQTFDGQMAKSAESVDGKIARLKLVIDETKEGIGAGLLPIASTLATVLLTKVVPPVQKASQWFDGLSDGTKTSAVAALVAVGGFLAVTAAVAKVASAVSTARDVMKGLHTAWQVGQAIARVYALSAWETVQPLLMQAKQAVIAAAGWIRNTAAMVANRAVSLAVAGASKALAAAQWLVNIAMTANPIGLVVVALVALGAGLVLAWKKSDTFRNIVTGAFKAVGRGVLTLASVWLQGMRGMVNIYLGFVGAVVSGAAKALGWVPGVGSKLRSAAAQFEQFKTSVSGKFDQTIGKVEQWRRKLDSVDKKKVTASVDVDESGAVAGAKKAQRAIDGVHGKTAKIGVDVVVHGKTVGFKQSNGVTQPIGKVLAYARGGPVIGAGTGVSDSVMAALSHGEYVSTAAAVRRYGVGTFEAMNAGRPIGGSTVVVNVNGGFASKYEIAATVRDAILDVERKTGRPVLAR